jgi:hypothetical protein
MTFNLMKRGFASLHLFGVIFRWHMCTTHGCQMAGTFSNQKNLNLGKFWEGLGRCWSILRPFGTCCDHLVYFSSFGVLYRDISGNPDCKSFITSPPGLFKGYWVYFSRFGMLYQEKSGNPDPKAMRCCYICTYICTT